jgi:integrating conjugative element protein (TIGR03761 family)
MSPGAMQMSAVVKFHSTQSINMFRGRKGDPEKGIRPIIGLARFARQVSLVWSAAVIDDPYADQVLLDIEQAYDAAKMSLDAKEKTMTNLLEGLDDFEVTLQASVQPVQITLQFYSPWGFRGAMLLKQFDKLIRMALTARHIGIFTEEDWVSIVRDAARSLRHMFNEVDGWVSTGVKREDIRNSTNVAKRAAARYEEIKKGYLVVDQEVISGLYRAKLSPVNRILEKYLSELAIEQLVPHEKKQATTGMVIINEAEKTKSKVAPNFGFNTINRNNTQIATSTTTEAVINSRDKVNAHTTESKSSKGDA